MEVVGVEHQLKLLEVPVIINILLEVDTSREYIGGWAVIVAEAAGLSWLLELGACGGSDGIE